MKKILILIVVLGVVGCVPFKRTLASAPLLTEPVEYANSVHFAADQEYLFKTLVRPLEVVEIQGRVSQQLALVNGHFMDKGELFYGVVASFEDWDESKTYCGVNFTYRNTGANPWRSCLIDIESDGKFDYAMHMPIPKRAFPYGSGQLLIPKKLDEPVSYLKVDNTIVPGIEIGVKYSSLEKTNQHRFFLIGFLDDGSRTLGFSEVYDPDVEVPFVINIGGAKIEIVEFTEDGVKYRLGEKASDPGITVIYSYLRL